MTQDISTSILDTNTASQSSQTFDFITSQTTQKSSIVATPIKTSLTRLPGPSSLPDRPTSATRLQQVAAVSSHRAGEDVEVSFAHAETFCRRLRHCSGKYDVENQLVYIHCKRPLFTVNVSLHLMITRYIAIVFIARQHTAADARY